MEAIWIRMTSALIAIGATRPAGRFPPLLPDLGRSTWAFSELGGTGRLGAACHQASDQVAEYPISSVNLLRFISSVLVKAGL
jgi:hypothetical protein